MKKKLFACLTALALSAFSASAFADSIIHMWTCELHSGKSADDLMAASSAWLKAAKKIKGGEDLEVYLDFRIAANVGDDEFNFILVAPDLETWGVWYGTSDPDSVMQDANDAWFEVASCSSSSLWNSVEIQ